MSFPFPGPPGSRVSSSNSLAGPVLPRGSSSQPRRLKLRPRCWIVASFSKFYYGSHSPSDRRTRESPWHYGKKTGPVLHRWLKPGVGFDLSQNGQAEGLLLFLLLGYEGKGRRSEHPPGHGAHPDARSFKSCYALPVCLEGLELTEEDVQHNRLMRMITVAQSHSGQFPHLARSIPPHLSVCIGTEGGAPSCGGSVLFPLSSSLNQHFPIAGISWPCLVVGCGCFTHCVWW